MSVQVNVCPGYCSVGRMSGRAYFYWASVLGLLFGQFTIRSSYCPVGLLSDRATVFQVSVSIGLLSVGDVSWGKCPSGYCPVGLLSGYQKTYMKSR